MRKVETGARARRQPQRVKNPYIGVSYIVREVVRMTSRLMLRGLAVFGALILTAALALTAVAQSSPVRVAQGSDGSLYVVQGNNSWKLVPDQISDSDLAALSPSGEIDGTLPNELLIVQAPSAPPAAAPAPAPPAAEQPAPAAQPPAPAPAPASPPPVTARPAPVASGPPQITITNPTEGQNVSAKGGQSSTITGTAFEPNGVPAAEVEVWIFGERNAGGATMLGTATVGSDGSWSVSFQPTRFTSTHTNIYVYARSKTGLETVASRGFNITG
jgi:hypothetical protein